MGESIQKLVFKIANVIELIISSLILLVIILSVFNMVRRIPGFIYVSGNYDENLSDFISSCFSLVIGIELVKMLVKHSVAIAVEVLVFSVARQMVVEHLTPTGIMISIIGLSGLFAIRKFLLKDFDSSEKSQYRGEQKVKLINFLEHIHLPYETEETIGELVLRELAQRNKEIGTGAIVTYKGLAIKIIKMSEGRVKRVELIKEII